MLKKRTFALIIPLLFISSLFPQLISSAQGITPPQPSSSDHLIYLPMIGSGDHAQALGPDGGDITALIVDPTNPQILYAGTYGGGIYKSADAGANWRPVSNGLDNVTILSLAINPKNPTILYAGTYRSGIYKSINGGESWWGISAGLNASAMVYTLAVDPQNPNTLYAGTRSPGSTPPWGGGVFKSLDGGSTWQNKTNGTGLGEDWVYSLAINPSNPAIVYAATHSKGIYKSTNGGNNWVWASSGIWDQGTVLGMRAVVVDPSQPSTLYAATWHGGAVFKSTDAGNSWKTANVGLAGKKIYSLVIHPKYPQLLYAAAWNSGTGGGIYKTANGGGSWSLMGLGADSIYAIAPDQNSTNIVYAGTAGDGLYKSADGAASIYSSDHGLKAAVISSVVIDPTQASRMVASIYGGGIMISTDAGADWLPANTGLGDKWLHALLMSPDNPRILYAASDSGGVYKSVDGGASWGSASTNLAGASAKSASQGTGGSPLPPADEPESDALTSKSANATIPPVLTLAIDQRQPSTLYAGTSQSGLYKSTNAGASWNTTGLGSGTINAIAVDPNSNLYAGADSGSGSLLKSIDGGASWSKKNIGLSGRTVQALSIDSLHPSRIFAGTDLGIFVTEDAGEHWILAGLANENVLSLGSSPNQPASLYAGTRNGAYFSMDGGVSWASAPSALDRKTVNWISISTSDPRQVFVGTKANSIFEWDRQRP